MAETPFFFSQRLAELTKTHGQHIALIDRDTETTFAQLEQQARQLAGNRDTTRSARSRLATQLPRVGTNIFGLRASWRNRTGREHALSQQRSRRHHWARSGRLVGDVARIQRYRLCGYFG